MNTGRISISEFLQLRQEAIVLDVRSPSEYNHAHIPDAINLPLFTDDERKVVGTSYKQESREKAIKIGLEYFGPKMRALVEAVENIIEAKRSNSPIQQHIEPSTTNHTLQTTNLIIYCWRGGMRSAAISWLLNLYGFSMNVLAGGYKSYRNHALKTFTSPFSFNVLGGYTGSGKTELLHALKNKGETIIDLEEIASHKGSAFGNINMLPQPTQEMFDNLLADALNYAVSKAEGNRIWIEDESQRIGLVNIPNDLWTTIRSSPVYFLEVPFEKRLEHLTEEYSKCDKIRMAGAIERISKRLGGLETKQALALLSSEDYKNCFAILLKYYDKHYIKGLQNRNSLDILLNKIHCDDVNLNNLNLLKPQPSYS